MDYAALRRAADRRQSTWRWTAVSLTVVVSTLLGAIPAAAAPRGGDIVGAGAPGAIKDRYIVTLASSGMSAESVAATADNLADRFDGSLRQVYGTAIKGFAVELSEPEARLLAGNPAVASVEQDRMVQLADTQTGAPWGLDRIDQPALPLSGTYTYPNTASAVTAYIIDTGVRLTHTEFGGRARSGYDFIDSDTDASDCNGHGTHVAGTVAGSTYGVAKQASIVAVRVLDCSGAGTSSGVLAGVDWVTANAVHPAVANMSLGGSASVALDTAVSNSIASGITYAIAAGNSDTDACADSPARVPAAITVGATGDDDARASFSNYGSCLDLFAPGVDITSSTVNSDTSTGPMSGTSMATPHVAGAAALALAADPTATPAQIEARLISWSSATSVTDPGTGSPSRLLQIGYPDGLFIPLPPTRVLDTRSGTGAVGDAQSIDVQVTGVAGVPSTGVGAVVLNVTGTEPTANTFVTVYPTGQTRPLASNLNLTPGLTAPNLVIAKVGTGGKVTLFNNAGNTHLVADVAGWLPATSDFTGLTPTRILDTRTGLGAVGAGQSIDVQVTGVAGVPSTGVGAVVLNVTGTEPTANTFVTVYPSGQTRPVASNLNLTPGQTRPNLVVAKVGTNGKVTLYNNAGATHLIADVAGWLPAPVLGAGSPAPAGTMTTNEFIAAAVPGAQQGWREYGVPPSVTIAQAILESGWGRSRLSAQDRNFFGIKCFNGSAGSIAIGCHNYATTECDPLGTCTPTVATFRIYATVADSFRDHGYFLRNNRRYAAAFTSGRDANAFLLAVWQAGYATDPQYYTKVTGLMAKYDLYRHDTWR